MGMVHLLINGLSAAELHARITLRKTLFVVELADSKGGPDEYIP